jgi:uncharacterized BrkB/YihY/UPF0761 family membrane protein
MTQVDGGQGVRPGGLVHRADTFQRHHFLLAYPYAVLRRFADEGSRYEAALVAFYAFFVTVPLLLVLVSVLGLLLRSNVELQARVLDSGFAQFPIIGDQLRRDVGSLDRTGLGLLIGVVLVAVGARGLSYVLQRASDSVWRGLPSRREPGPERPDLSLQGSHGPVLVGLVAVALVAGSVVIGFLIGDESGSVFIVVALVLVGALNWAVLTATFWLTTHGRLAARELAAPALAAGLSWAVLEVSGGLLLDHEVAGSTEVSAFFAIVIGLITWLYVGSLATLYAMQAHLVWVLHLWPRPLRRSMPSASELELDPAP